MQSFSVVWKEKIKIENGQEMTVPDVSVGADTELPVSNLHDNRIHDNDNTTHSIKVKKRE